MKLDTMSASVFFRRSRDGRNDWPLILHELS